MYPISFLFNIPSTAYITMIVVNLFVGLTATLATFVLDLFDDPELSATNAILKKAFLVFPNYCLGRGILDVARHEYETQYDEVRAELSGNPPPVFSDPLAWELAGRNLFLMAIQAAFWLLFTLGMEYRNTLRDFFITRPMGWLRRQPAAAPEDLAGPGLSVGFEAGTHDGALDTEGWQQAYDSVNVERARVAQGSNGDNLRVLELRKSYQKRDVSK